MREAAFTVQEHVYLPPVNVHLEDGQTTALPCANAMAARVAARIAAGMIKCTTGEVFVGNFDPKIQPANVKRIAGFIPAEIPANPFSNTDAFLAYRAALWNLEREPALNAGRAALSSLRGLQPHEALWIASVMMGAPRLLIAELPAQTRRNALENIRNDAALFVTQ